MMKTLHYLFLFLSWFAVNKAAFAQTYQFNVIKNQSYANLTQDVLLFDTLVPYDDNIYTQGSYKLFGRTFKDTLYINSYGRIIAWNDSDIVLMDINLSFVNFPDTNSNISYVEEGQPGKRILKIQWKNMGQDGYPDARYNLQVWLYEGDETVEYRFGPCTACSFGNVTRLERYFENYGNLKESYFPKGDPNNPSLNNDTLTILDSLPEAGTIYRFAYLGLNVNNKTKQTVKIYPNPGFGVLHLEGSEWRMIRVADAKGQEIQYTQTGSLLKLESVKPGLYYIRALDQNGKWHLAKYSLLNTP